MAQWIGYMVSIKCADDNAYQGEINLATNTEISLIKAFYNGTPCPENEVTIRANEIVELKLIDKQSTSTQQRSTITIAKPVPKRIGRSQSTSECTPNIKINGSHAKSKPIDIDFNNKVNFNESNSFKHSSSTPNNHYNGNNINFTNINNNNNNNNSINGNNGSSSSTNGKKYKFKNSTKDWRDEVCFGSPLDNINKDFDFERNLALFNKKAIWNEINSQKPDVIKRVKNKKNLKYRHDENVIATMPTTYRQIIVPKQDFCEYVTDDGLIIPSVSSSLRNNLFEAADKVGLSWEKRIELLGRATSEISIQLLGGAHRLNPRNSHQCPIVVVLCGPHKQGAVGINTARQLASHGIQTFVYTVSTEAALIKKELALYMLTKNHLMNSLKDLPSLTDLIIIALCEDTENPKHYVELAEWTNKNKAPVLAVDPPSTGTPGFNPKYSILPVLPLPHSSRNGKLYLCNLGFPVDIYNEVGIKYKSPFGSKFVIPLHPKDD